MAGALVPQILYATARIQCWSITSAGGLSASTELKAPDHGNEHDGIGRPSFQLSLK